MTRRYEPKYRKHFSSKHNLLAKRWKERIAEAKVKRTIKPQLTLRQKIKLKVLKAMLFLWWSPVKKKSRIKK